MLTVTTNSKPERGFTLIEVLLAMAITAFVAVIAYTGLSTAINAAEVNEAQAKRLAEIHMAINMLERDIRHAVLRPIIDEYGDQQPPLVGGNTATFPLELTRSGFDNPREVRRSDLERVRYYLEDQELWRASWAVLDRVNYEETLQELRLIENIEDMRLRFLDGNSTGAKSSPLGGEWVDVWVYNNRFGSFSLPLAIEYSLDIAGFGEVIRVIEIGAH